MSLLHREWRWGRVRRFVAVALAALAIWGAGCGQAERAQTGSRAAPDLAVAVLSSDLAVGPARLVLALRQLEGRPLAGGPLHLRLMLLPDRSEVAAYPRPSGTPGLAYYVAAVNFPTAGTWEVQVEAPSGRPEAPFSGRAFVEVHPAPAAPPVGVPAPRVAVPYLSGATPLAERTSLPDPDPSLYQVDPAAVMGRGRPVVITFAAPSHCPGDVCGAQIAVLSELRVRYGDRLHVVHVDPFPVQPIRAETPAVFPSWNLRTQPWTFVIDRGGVIAARFEGFVSLAELGEAVDAVVGAAAGQTSPAY